MECLVIRFSNKQSGLNFSILRARPGVSFGFLDIGCLVSFRYNSAVNNDVFQCLWTEKDLRDQASPVPSLCYPLTTGSWPMEGREPGRGSETKVRGLDNQRGFVEDDNRKVAFTWVMEDV